MLKKKILKAGNIEIVQCECHLKLKDGFIILTGTRVREFVPIPGMKKKEKKT